MTDDLWQALEAAVLDGPGALPVGERRAIAAGGPDPGDLASYLDRVRRRAFTVTDAEVEGLLARGRSEDEVLEATLAAALGAGRRRLEAARAAIAAAT